MTRSPYSRSSFKSSGVFACQCCGHQTRESGQDDDRFCNPCVELMMMGNTLSDDGLENFLPWGPKARDQWVAKIAKRGGDVAKVRAFMPRLFAPEVAA